MIDVHEGLPNQSLDATTSPTTDLYGGPVARAALERRLLRKLDARMSILVVIYILNYVKLQRIKQLQS